MNNFKIFMTAFFVIVGMCLVTMLNISCEAKRKTEKGVTGVPFDTIAPSVNGSVTLYIYRLKDGCQYLGMLGRFNSDVLTHYGLCDNPKHRQDSLGNK